MDIWDYDRVTGALLGQGAADEDPERNGGWLLPAFATTIRPPFVPAGCVAIFDGGLSGQGSWRIELKAVDDIRQRLSPELALLVTSIDEICRRADLDHAIATRLVVDAAEATIGRVSDSEELRAEAGALLQEVLGAQRVN